MVNYNFSFLNILSDICYLPPEVSAKFKPKMQILLNFAVVRGIYIFVKIE